MEIRISTGTKNNPSYLYCSVDCQVSNYDAYASAKEAFNSIKDEILIECESRGYDEYDTDRVLDYYFTLFSNSSVWS